MAASCASASDSVRKSLLSAIIRVMTSSHLTSSFFCAACTCAVRNCLECRLRHHPDRMPTATPPRSPSRGSTASPPINTPVATRNNGRIDPLQALVAGVRTLIIYCLLSILAKCLCVVRTWMTFSIRSKIRRSCCKRWTSIGCERLCIATS